MTTYAVAREVPEWHRFLTAGKRYEVLEEEGTGFQFRDDLGAWRGTQWVGSAHIGYQDWHRIETDAEGWEDWKPSKNGESPPDWQEGWEWEILGLYNKWSVPDKGKPSWFRVRTYRYRPRVIAETAQVEPAQVECDHPNADDYRNRAERAEAELAELKEHVRNLEALACGQLFEGDV